MTEARELRREAMRVLAAAGWPVERIGLALGITKAGVERAVRPATAKPRAALRRPVAVPPGLCCEQVGMRLWCDVPVAWRGAVYCAQHYRSGLRA